VAVKEINAAVPQEAFKFKVGDAVEALYAGKDAYYSGTIAHAYIKSNANMYNINYDDGEQETEVPEKFIKIFKNVENPGKNNNNVSSSSSSSSSIRFKENEAVETNYQGKGVYYPGVIGKDRQDGTYDINYDDGEKEYRIPTHYIRYMPGKLSSAYNNDEPKEVISLILYISRNHNYSLLYVYMCDSSFN